MSRNDEIDILMRSIFNQIQAISNVRLDNEDIHLILIQMDNIKSKVDDFFDLKDEIYNDKSELKES